MKVFENHSQDTRYNGPVETSQSVVAQFGTGGNNTPFVVDSRKYIVRRLTPTECARLQGFPDWWCEGLGGSDSAIYKAYGNGLALPCAYDVLSRIAGYMEEKEEI